MNPATVGLHKQPYKYPIPLGLFVIQEKISRMVYLTDGSHEIGRFAPYASHFSNGAYLHGVPIGEPKKNPVEFSWSLGTTPPISYMCLKCYFSC